MSPLKPAFMLALIASQVASALEAYRPFADQPVAPWKQSNDAVLEAGGWRAYAREAQSPASAPQPAAAASAPASAPASSPHAGHH